MDAGRALKIKGTGAFSRWAVFAVVLAFGLGMADAQDPRGFRGTWNSWGYDSMTLDLDVWRVTVRAPFAHQGGTNVEFKVAAPEWAHGEWTRDGSISLATVEPGYTGGGTENTLLNTTAREYYTFAMNNVGYNVQGLMIVQETADTPVSINSVSHGVNAETATVSIVTSATPSSGEKIYVRYTLDNWNSSTFVQATGSGTSWAAQIVHDPQDTGQTCIYYVLTTTVVTPTHQHADLQTIRWNNNNGAMYSYTVESSGTAETPTTQTSAIQFSSVGSHSMTVSWTAGNGANRLVVAREGGAVTSHPVDETGYTADNRFGDGSEVGSGNYVVYSGSGSTVDVKGLSPLTTYHFRVYEFNGGGGSAMYNRSTASGNPASIMTTEAPPFELYINEVMASNDSTIQDEDGDWPDWVELYNAGPEAVHLEGWGLSDNYGNPFKWVFGDVTIQSEEFLVVWASGKDRPEGDHLHTSWAISAAGEEVILTHPDGTRVDELEPVAIPTDVSLGRQPDGTGDWLFFTTPTPGAANTTEGTPGFLELPQFSVEGGLYSSSQALEITTAEQGAEIRYTTDGSEPTASSPLYSGPIALNSRAGTPNRISEIPTNYLDPYGEFREGWLAPDGEVFKIHTVRARLFKDGYLPSPAVTHSYLIDSAGVNRYSLPIVSIATDSNHLFSGSTGIYVPENYWNRGRDWERPGTIEFFESDGELAFRQDIGIRIHGGTTRNRPRKSLRIYARGPRTFRHQLFPDKDLDRFSTFILRNSGNDWGEFAFRDLFMQSLSANTDLDRMYGRPVVVFINGEYWGMHNMRERFDDGYIEHNYGLEEHEFVQFESTWDGMPQNVEGLPHYDRGNADYASAYMDLHNYIRDQGVQSSANYEHVQNLMDIDNFIDFYQAHIFYGNTDWPGNNIRMWRSVETNRTEGAPYRHDARLRFMVFDTDFGFGLDFPYVPGRDQFASHNTLAFAASPHETHFSNKEHHTVMFRRLLENDDFRDQFIMRFSDQLNTAYSRAAVTNKLAELVAIVGPEMNEHVHRWRQPYDWANEINRVRSYGEQRTGAVWGHLQSQFNLGSRHELTVDVNDTDQGSVRVRDIDLAEGTDGFFGYPWTGSYFSDYPVTLTAVAQPGYRFVEWVAIEDAHTVLASDSRANYSSWNTGDNQGTGFGSWTLTSAANSGHFLGDAGWGFWAHSNHEANAVRPFNSALAVGQTFSVRMQNGWIDNGRSVGVALQNSSGQPLWEMYFIGGEESYRINNNPSGIQWTSGALDIEVTLTGSTTWTARIEPGGHEFSGSLLSQGNQTIDRFRAWNHSAGDGSNYDFFINNLQIFTTASGTPEFYSADESIDVTLSGASSFEAVFEEIVPEEATLVHYWNFNDTANLLAPTYTLVAGAGITVDTVQGSEATYGDGQDFWGENARFGDAAETHLRINIPTGAVMNVSLPTTGFEDVVVMYETRRSGSGAGTQNIEYTLNGSTYTPFTTLTITETPTLHAFDFTGISDANDNANFGMRVAFEIGTGGAVGNNRFDNMTLEGVALGELNLPPEVDNPIEFQELIQGAAAASFNLNNVFTDPDGDPMTFDASSSDTDLVTVNVDGSTLSVTPVRRGEARVTVTADDGNNPEVSFSFRVLVYPDAYVLENGNFTFGEWDPDTPEKTYPEHMLFLQSDQDDTAIDTPLVYAYHLEADDYHADDIAAGTVGQPYNNTGRTRINGLGADGIAFINTGQGRDLGGALLALDTRNVTNAPVGWLAGTILANSREYAIRLQYRGGATGDFIDVLDGNNDPVVYVRQTDGHTQPMDPVNLPAEAMDEEYVQLLWRYYRTSEEYDSGPRAQLRLDDILVANSEVLPATELVYGVEPPDFYQSGQVLPAVTVLALDPNGLLDTDYDGTVTLTVAGTGSLAGTTAVAAEEGIATFTDVTLTGLGTNRIQASSGSLTPALTEELSFADVTGLIVPSFLQGEQDALGDNNDRIPFAYRAQLEGLRPNATYRYGNRVVTAADPWDQNGAGNMIFVTGAATDWIRNTDSPRFRDTDLGGRHYEFTTDATGSYTGWFITEPSGNARFAPGNTVWMRILLNDGQGGEDEQHYLTLSDEITVIRFGTQAHEATGIMGESTQAAKHFVYLYDNTDGTGRPLAGVPVEITGSEVDDRYALFYEQVVATTPEFWGTLIPNTLPTGVRRIEYRALSDASIPSADTSVGGMDGTIDPSSGLNAIFLGADVGIPVFLPGGDGRWDVHVNWSTGVYPDGVDQAAIVREPLDGPRDVEIESSITVGNLIVDNALSTNRNRIRTRGPGVTLTFQSSSGPAELTIDGAGSGFVEFRTEETIVLQSDLLITITNVHENHGKEGFFDDDYGALRFRDDWTGPGGLIKEGAGVMSLTGDGKAYAGETVVNFGVLRVTAPATPTNTSGVAVNPGGQLRLVSSSDELEPVRVHAFGGDLVLNSLGRGGDVPGEEMGMLGALRYDPGSNDNAAEVVNNISIEGPTSLHVDGTRNEMDLSGPISGAGAFSKSGGGTLVLSGDSSGYTVPVIVSNGQLRVDGTLGSSVSVNADGSVGGSGTVGALSGSGTVQPGPGTETLTAPSVNGLSYRFVFTETEAGILRLTGGAPFINPLNPANDIEIFWDVVELNENDVFEGGFFTDQDANFLASIENADWTFYVRDEEGSVEHEGENWSAYDGELDFAVSTVSSTIDFGEGDVHGRILRIALTDDGEPTGFAAWQNEEFTPEELADPEVSGPYADPEESGIPNLLRYALGLGRHDAYEGVLPDGKVDAVPVFRHRRLIAEDPGIEYVIEVSDDLVSGEFQNVDMGEDLIELGATPTGDGITEIVEYEVPGATLDTPKYFRLKVLLEG